MSNISLDELIAEQKAYEAAHPRPHIEMPPYDPDAPLPKDEPIPDPPYHSTADLICILTHVGDKLTVDGQRWLLRLLSDAFEEPHEADRKLLPAEWQQAFMDEKERWAYEEVQREYEDEQYEAFCHAMDKDD